LLPSSIVFTLTVYCQIFEAVKPEEDNRVTRMPYTKSKRSKEVNRIFGWAIHSLMKRIQNEVKELNESNSQRMNGDDKEAAIIFLTDMRVFEHEILGNDYYLKHFYNPADMLRNDAFSH
jgi:hypothetical protein